MILLVDIGNTNTHIALATPERILAQTDVPTALLLKSSLVRTARKLGGGTRITDAIIASVVPKAVPELREDLKRRLGIRPLVVNAGIPLGIRLDYPNPRQLGADRLANAVATLRLYGAPAVAVDFGTAVTFDVIDRRGAYVGGVIAPGVAVMTDYMYQRTALLPKIDLAEPRTLIGKSTVQAMQIGAVVGYRGLVKELLAGVKRELGARKLCVVATGGYGGLIANRIPEIQHVNPLLTLEGLRFIYLLNRK